MINALKFMLGISFVLLFAVNAAFADPQSTIYRNQRGSTMTLNWDDAKDAGILTGTFTTVVSKCKAVIGKPIPVTGVYNGRALALTVNYPECGSVLAMSGNLSKDKNEMNLHWFVTRQVEGSLSDNWDTTATGTDQYKMQ